MWFLGPAWSKCENMGLGLELWAKILGSNILCFYDMPLLRYDFVAPLIKHNLIKWFQGARELAPGWPPERTEFKGNGYRSGVQLARHGRDSFLQHY